MWWQDTIKETKGKGGYLEKYPSFDWEPVKLKEDDNLNRILSDHTSFDYCELSSKPQRRRKDQFAQAFAFLRSNLILV